MMDELEYSSDNPDTGSKEEIEFTLVDTTKLEAPKEQPPSDEQKIKDWLDQFEYEFREVLKHLFLIATPPLERSEQIEMALQLNLNSALVICEQAIKDTSHEEHSVDNNKSVEVQIIHMILQLISSNQKLLTSLFSHWAIPLELSVSSLLKEEVQLQFRTGQLSDTLSPEIKISPNDLNVRTVDQFAKVCSLLPPAEYLPDILLQGPISRNTTDLLLPPDILHSLNAYSADYRRHFDIIRRNAGYAKDELFKSTIKLCIHHTNRQINVGVPKIVDAKRKEDMLQESFRIQMEILKNINCRKLATLPANVDNPFSAYASVYLKKEIQKSFYRITGGYLDKSLNASPNADDAIEDNSNPDDETPPDDKIEYDRHDDRDNLFDPNADDSSDDLDNNLTKIGLNALERKIIISYFSRVITPIELSNELVPGGYPYQSVRQVRRIIRKAKMKMKYLGIDREYTSSSASWYGSAIPDLTEKIIFVSRYFESKPFTTISNELTSAGYTHINGKQLTRKNISRSYFNTAQRLQRLGFPITH